VLLLLVAIPISPVAGIICLGANCRLCAVSIRLRFLGACSASPIRFVGSEVLFVLGICYLGGFLRLCQSNLRARVPTNSMALFIPVVVCSASFVELAKLFVSPCLVVRTRTNFVLYQRGWALGLSNSLGFLDLI
jgi:hypothetical protein